ncbi:hypothetical protein GMOD_00001336 [Pyrenophora seminiperda CCB06]|uniref:Uncharacterized protein n=1 Tax=Pyrenophora seminiperda CCB06 TaxID=1302712 RepID=A0A3M7LYV8_9PLEO|nr:hypothetical protein GMOD_00001336 [Pyrenophora seminiperda CCB06]
MRSDLWLLATLGLANARISIPHQTRDSPSTTPWHPKTDHPEFFSLIVDSSAWCNHHGGTADCTLNNYAIRLKNGIVYATPYTRRWDPKLPIMFVDDDTTMYTASKLPQQFYVDTTSGALRYAPVGWLPPNSISTSFYHTGDNPVHVTGPSTAFLSWPSTQGVTSNALYRAPWWLCPHGRTKEYQVFVANGNFGLGNWEDSSSGISKDPHRLPSLHGQPAAAPTKRDGIKQSSLKPRSSIRNFGSFLGPHFHGQVENPQESILDGGSTTIDSSSIVEVDSDVEDAIKYLSMDDEQESGQKAKLEDDSGDHYRIQRHKSLHVSFSSTELKRLKEEIYNETIAEVHLSLLIYWINEDPDNYDLAKDVIRELRCDKGYNPSRVDNAALRQLLTETKAARPLTIITIPKLPPPPPHRQPIRISIWIHLDIETNEAVVPVQPTEREDDLADLTADPIFVGRHTRKLPGLPRIDSLPPALSLLRERRNQAALRSISLASVAPSSPQGTYPPDTPDRPLPLVPRSASSTLLSPSSAHLSPFPPSRPRPTALPFGFPSPGSPVREVNDNMSALEEYDCSSPTGSIECDEYRAHVDMLADRLTVLQSPEQLAAIMAELKDLRAMYRNSQV